MNLAYSAVQTIRRQSFEQSARRSRAEHIRSSSRSFRDERRPRAAFQASDENVRRGRKRRTPIDGARTVVPSQARSRTRLQKLGVLTIEGRVVLSPSGLPAAFAGNSAALFSLLRRGLLRPLLVVFSVAASSLALRPLASKAALVSA